MRIDMDDGHASDDQLTLFCRDGIADKLELMLIMLHVSECDRCLGKVVELRAAMSRGACQTVACFQRHQQLLAQFAQVASEYQAMQKVELDGVLNGEDFPFDDWIEEAAARMSQAKQGLREYRQEHG
jgi:hypothetical protein